MSASSDGLNARIVRLQPAFFRRHGLIGAMLLLFCLVIVLVLRQLGPWRWALPLVFVGPWLAMVLRERALAVRQIDRDGLTRQDGRRFAWPDLVRIQEVKMYRHGLAVGPVNHVDFIFSGGRVRFLPRVLEDGWQALNHARAAAGAWPPPAPPRPTGPCATCGALGPAHRGMQKHAREQDDSFLPPAASRLKTIKQRWPGRHTSPTLKQCPECGAWFYYKETYEYHADGGEDDQELIRLTPDQAQAMLHDDSAEAWRR